MTRPEAPPDHAADGPPSPAEPAPAGGRVRALLRSYMTPAGKRALRNLIGLVVCTAISQGLGFWGLIILTNGLGPEGYAAIALGATVQWYLVAVGSCGLPLVVVRDLTRDPAGRDGTISAFLGTTAALATAVGAAGVVAAWVLPLGPGERFYLTVVGLCNVAACLNFAPLYDVAHRQAFVAALVLPLDVANVLVLLALQAGGVLAVRNVAALYAAKVVLTMAIPAVVYHARVGRIRWRFDRRRAAALLAAGWPLMVTTVVAMLPLQVGVLLARVWRPGPEVGLYGLAVAIASAHLGVGILAVRVVQPHANGEYGTYASFVRKYVLFCGLLLGALGLATAAAAYLLVTHILTPDYRPALAPTFLLLVATTGLLVGAFANTYLLAFGRERLMMILYVIGAAVYLVVAAAVRDISLSGLAAAAAVSTSVTGLGAAAAAAALWPAHRTDPPA